MIDKPAMAAVAAALALALAWWQQVPAHSSPAATASPGGASAAPLAPAPTATFPASVPAPATRSPSALAIPARASSPSTTGSRASAGGATAARTQPRLPSVESYQLSRTLPTEQGEQDIHFEGRLERIIGTRNIADERGPQTILITRDEASGALSYWQSGLRFALVPGQDHEAYVRANPRFTRRFVNTDYADVALDPAHLAEAYRQLSTDPRVASVRLLALPRQDKLK